MSARKQLNHQIERCSQEIENERRAFIKSLNTVHQDSKNFKKYAPLFVNSVIGLGFVLLISPRARSFFKRFNNKLFIGLLNIRMGMQVLPLVINLLQQGRKVYSNL